MAKQTYQLVSVVKYIDSKGRIDVRTSIIDGLTFVNKSDAVKVASLGNIVHGIEKSSDDSTYERSYAVCWQKWEGTDADIKSRIIVEGPKVKSWLSEENAQDKADDRRKSLNESALNRMKQSVVLVASNGIRIVARKGESRYESQYTVTTKDITYRGVELDNWKNLNSYYSDDWKNGEKVYRLSAKKLAHDFIEAKVKKTGAFDKVWEHEKRESLIEKETPEGFKKIVKEALGKAVTHLEELNDKVMKLKR